MGFLIFIYTGGIWSNQAVYVRTLLSNSKGISYACPPWYEVTEFTWFQIDPWGSWEVASASLPSAYSAEFDWCLLAFHLISDGLLIKHYLWQGLEWLRKLQILLSIGSLTITTFTLLIPSKPYNCYYRSFWGVIKNCLETELSSSILENLVHRAFITSLNYFLHYLGQTFFHLWPLILCQLAPLIKVLGTNLFLLS